MIYSLVETSKAIGVNPHVYLRKVALLAIDRQGATLLPHDQL